jgi:single-strand DNA-binding protein
MATINKVMIMGNLTRDPELRYVQSGAAVCEFAVALNETYTNKQTGQKTEKVHFIDVVCWGRTAEVASEYLAKGSPVHVEGKLQQDRWEDQGGQNRSKVKVTCERLTLVGSKKNGQGGGASHDHQAAPAPGQEEDIPF